MQVFFLACIFGNSVLVAMFDPYREGWKQNAYNLTGWVFAGCFYLEMFLKIGGVGTFAYFNDYGHLGDFAMNALVFVEICMVAYGMTPANMQYMFVRSLRVFRVMRLAAASENLREVRTRACFVTCSFIHGLTRAP